MIGRKRSNDMNIIIETNDSEGRFCFESDNETRPRVMTRKLMMEASKAGIPPVIDKWSLNWDSVRANYIFVTIDKYRVPFYLKEHTSDDDWFETLSSVSSGESKAVMYYCKPTNKAKRRRAITCAA